MTREASVERNTKETEIKLKLVLDGTGYSDIETGVGFFDHMLDGFTRHGLFDLSVRVHGDLNVDDHHTIEDTGIVLGNAIKEAIGNKKGIRNHTDTFPLFFMLYLLGYFTLILSNPSPNTPITALCETKAFGSISLIKRKIVVDSRFFANTNIILTPAPV